MSWVLWNGLLSGALMLELSFCCPEDLGAEERMAQRRTLDQAWIL